MKGKKDKFISITVAAELTPYSGEYLSLRARQGQLKAKKNGRNWFTTSEWVREYLARQVSVNVANLSRKGIMVRTAAELPDLNFYGHAVPETVMPEKQFVKPKEESEKIFEDPVLRLRNNVELFHRIRSAEEEERARTEERAEDQFEKFVSRFTDSLDRHTESHLGIVRNGINWFKRESKSILRSWKKSSVVFLILLSLVIIPATAALGKFDDVVWYAYQKVRDAETLRGHTPGYSANQVLLLDKEGKISIIGHIETEGQLRSFIADGVAPIVVDSATKVENLNADYLDGLSSEDFTLAFVTKNGNITHEDVFLEGRVEVGKTLTVKGATKLLSSLEISGEVRALADVFLAQNLSVKGVASMTTLAADFITARLINARVIRGDSVIATALESTDTFLAKNMTVNGQSVFNGMTLHSAGLTGTYGVFQKGLDVAGSMNVSGKTIKLGTIADSNITLNSQEWNIQKNGIAQFASTTVNGLLAVTGSGTSTVDAHLKLTNLEILGACIGCGALAQGATGWTDDGVAIRLTTASDFVGIGTTSPFAKLSVIGAGTTTGFAFAVANSTSTTLFAIQDNGNIGIGTTSPYARLSVVGDVVASSFIATSSATSTFAGGISTNAALNVTSTSASSTFANGITLSGGCFAQGSACIGGSNFTGSGSANSIAKFTGPTALGNSQLFDDGLFVGIGTSTPLTAASRSLAIYGSTTIQVWENVPTAFQILNAATTSVFTVNTVTGTTTIDGGVGGGASTTNLIVSRGFLSNAPTSTFSGGLVAGANTALTVNTNASANSLYIAANGNVGIGMTGPGQKLDIAGGNITVDDGYTFGDDAFPNYEGYIPKLASDDGGVLQSSSNLYFNIDSNNNETTRAFVFAHDNTTSLGTELFRIQENGNVGIGTSTPLTPLSVYGSTTIQTWQNVPTAFRVLNAATTSVFTVNTVTGTTTIDGGAGGGASTTNLIVSRGFLSNAPTSTFSGGLTAGANTALTVNTNASANSLYIAANGNIGIGVTSPATNLHIRNSGVSGKTFTNNVGLVIENDGSSNSYYALQVSTAGANDAFSITNAGNVGIGTVSVSPATSLEIWKNGGATTTLVNSNTVISAGDLLGALAFRSEDNSTNGTLVKAYVQGVAETTFTGGNHRSALYFGTAASDVVATTKMVLSSDGNLGIGTTSPTARLHIAGNSTDQFVLEGIIGNPGAWTELRSNEDGVQGRYFTRYWSDYDNNSQGKIARFSVQTNGNVGIGTSTPSNTFAVLTPDQNAVINIYGVSASLDYGVIQSTSNGGAVAFGQPRTLALQPAGGNVGIGTTSPGSLLSVGNTNGINFSTATSTFSTTGGITLANGCFATPSGCVVSGSGAQQATGWTDDGSVVRLTTASDFVGIGTSTPLTPLSVYGSTTIQTWQNVPTAFRVLNAATTSVFTVDTVNGSTSIAGLLNVGGAGTSTINQNLHVQGTLQVGNGSLWLSNNWLTSDGTFTIANKNSTSNDIILNAGRNVGIGTTTPFGVLSVHATSSVPSFVIGSSTATSFIVDASGRVGIGTTSPYEEFSLSGKIAFEDTAGVDSGNPKIFVGTQGDTKNSPTGVSTYGDTGNGIILQYGGSSDTGGIKLTDDGVLIWGAGDEDLFRVLDEDQNSTVFVITDYNNNPACRSCIGIASTTPWGLLSVNANGIGSAPQFVVGSSTATSFIVDANGRVGIGTAVPTSLLHVVQNSDATAIATFMNNGIVNNSALDIIGRGSKIYGFENNSSSNSTIYFENSESGNISVGIASTTPWGLLSVNPNGISGPAFAVGSSTQCVTGDTRLRRRRRKKRRGNGITEDDEEYLYDEVMITNVRPGDEVLSLNEKTGWLEYRRVKALMDMGVKMIYKLTTASGKTIRTTENHPYLARKTRGWMSVFFGYQHNQSQQDQHQGAEDIKIGHNSVGIIHNYSLMSATLKNQENTDKIPPAIITGQLIDPLTKGPMNMEAKNTWPISLATADSALSLAKDNSLYPHHIATAGEGQWTKVAYLTEGMEIAVVAADGTIAIWDSIVKIEHLPEEQVYDIEVEGTHNFIGNDIVAHNTYLTVTNGGNVGIGTANPSSFVHIAASNSGQDGLRVVQTDGVNSVLYLGSQSNNPLRFFGTSGNDSGRWTFGGSNGRLFFSRGSDNTDILTLDAGGLAVGIGTTSPATRLSVAGNTYLDSNVITYASSSAANLTFAYQRAATSTVPSVANVWAIATTVPSVGRPIFSIDASGDGAVGIFTATPQMRGIEIAPPGNKRAELGLISTSGAGSAIYLGNNLTYRGAIVNNLTSGGGLQFLTGNNDLSGFSSGTTDQNGISAIRMTMLTDGRIGIGTTSPNAFLDIKNMKSPEGVIASSLTDVAGANLFSIASDATVNIGPSSGVGTFGYPVIGGSTDSSDSNYMTATKFTTGGSAILISSISVYVASPIDASPNDQFQVAIYSDSSGAPGSLVASSGSGTLTGDAWNTASISTTLSANTIYWLVYNTNGTASAMNNMKKYTGASGSSCYVVQAFGSWPASFGACTSYAGRYSIYASFSRTQVVVTASGSVGIGTTSPWAKLSVTGASDLGNFGYAGYFVATTTATSTFAGGISTNLLNVQSTSASSTFANGIVLANGCFLLANNTCAIGAVGAQLASGWADDGSVVRLTTASDFVGIGTTSPATRLSVAGNAYFDSNVITYASSTASSTIFAYQRSATSTIPSVANAWSIATSTDPFAGRPVLSVSGSGLGGVGIFTANPSVNGLEIAPPGNARAELGLISTSGAGAKILFGDDQEYNGAITWNGVASNALEFRAGADGSGTGVENTRMTILPGGNVGIGTTSPAFKLHIAGNEDTFGNAGMEFEGLSSNSGSRNWVVGNALGPNYGSFDLSVGSAQGANPTSAGIKLSILSSGNLGIGTTSPWTKLSVTGSSDLGNFGYAGYFAATSTTATSTFSGGFVAGNNAALTVNQAASANSLYIAANGNVGIGTAGPVQTLDVNGNLTASKATFGSNVFVGSEVLRVRGSLALYDSASTAGQMLLSHNNAAGNYYELNFGLDSIPGSTYIRGYAADGKIVMSGNVGIASTSPWGLLSVNANALAAGAPQFVVGSSTQTSFIVDQSGRVGIGTTSPVAKLQVLHNGSNGSTGLGDFGIITTGTAGQITLGAEAIGDLYANLNLGSNIAGTRKFWHISKRLAAASHDLQYFYYDGAGFNFHTVFATSGNVGIGETAPGSKLSVSGGGSFGASYDTTAAPTNGLIIEGSVGIGTTSPAGYLNSTAGRYLDVTASDPILVLHNTGTTKEASFYNHSTGLFIDSVGAATPANNQIVFRTNNTASSYASNLITAMTIASTGNIGIGTTDIEAWASSVSPTIESVDTSISFGDDTDIHMTSNGYYDGSWKYKTTDLAANYYQNKGTHNWRVAGSGTADAALTWTNAMSIGASGAVLIGNISAISGSPNSGELGFANNSSIKWKNQAGSSFLAGITVDTSNNLLLGGGTTDTNINVGSFGTAMVVKATTGNIGLGTTAPDAKVQISGGGLCVGSAANCNTDNNTEGTVYSGATSMTLYDVAENYPTKDESLVAEEIVSLDAERGVFVKRAASASDILLGVISEKPAVHLGGFNGAQFAEERQVAVALSGRVPVKISTEGGPIKIGDRIVLSSLAGIGTKATTSGMSIGIALEDFSESSEGEWIDLENQKAAETATFGGSSDNPRSPNLTLDCSIANQQNLSSGIVDNSGGAGAAGNCTPETQVSSLGSDYPGPSTDVSYQSNGTMVKTGKILVFVNLGYSPLEVDSQFASGSSTPTALIDGATGQFASALTGNLDMGGNDIANVRSVVSANGKWSIGEDGTLRAVRVVTEELIAENVRARLVEAERVRAREVEADEFRIFRPAQAEEASVGEGRILRGETETAIYSSKLASTSKIFVSFTSDLQGRSYFIDKFSLFEVGLQTGVQPAFKVKISAPLPDDATFDWWAVNTVGSGHLPAIGNTATNSEPPPAEESALSEPISPEMSPVELKEPPSPAASNELPSEETASATSTESALEPAQAVVELQPPQVELLVPDGTQENIVASTTSAD